MNGEKSTKPITRIIDYGYREEDEQNKEEGSYLDRLAEHIKQRQELAREKARRVV